MIKHFSNLNTYLIGYSLFTMICLWSCSDLGTNPEKDDNIEPSDIVSYNDDIQPIFNQSCGSYCHLNSSSGGLSLSSYNGLMSGGDNGVVIVSGDASGSVLIQKLSNNPPFGDRMPKGNSALDTDKIELITTWINDGAENN
jgi:hypothetical protein